MLQKSLICGAVKNKIAFTLAEVLITLGIIGVVAAMTMPALLNKTNNKELQVQLKKTYNELSQINQKFMYDYGMSMCEYDQTSNSKTTESGETLWFSKLPDVFKSYLKPGKEVKLVVANLHTLSGKNLEDYMLFDDGIFRDVSGRVYYFEFSAAWSGKCPIITVDINGVNKKPNRLGYDIFAFRPTIDGRMIPFGTNMKSKDTVTDRSGNPACDYNEDSSVLGSLACAYYALNDTSPEDSSKSYWKDFLK